MTTYFLTVISLLALAAAGLWWHHRRVTADNREGAKVEYQRLQETDAALVEGLNEARFAEIYRRAHAPRAGIYWVAALALFFLGTPLVMGLLSAGAWAMAETGMVLQPPDNLPEGMVIGDGEATWFKQTSPEFLHHLLRNFSGFYSFFGLLGYWALVVWLVMRRYYQRKPGFLRQEILRAR